jgi:hypothetical protein
MQIRWINLFLRIKEFGGIAPIQLRFDVLTGAEVWIEGIHISFTQVNAS